MSIQAVASNLLCTAADNWQRNLLFGYRLRLFRSPLAPVPDTPIASFVESNFVGYTALPLSVLTVPVPYIGVPGQATTRPVPFNFVPTVSDPTQLAYGWWIGDSLFWYLAAAFNSPQPIIAATSIQVTLSFQAWSLSVIP